MRAVKIFAAWPLVAVLALTAVAPHIGPVDPIPAPLAHSALLTLEGAAVPGAVILRVRPTSAAPLGVSDIAVTINGKAAALSARADGGWRAVLPPGTASGAGTLEVAVTHDGIRELLQASLPLTAADVAPASAAPGRWGVHNQIFWWILNIAIVLVAALAISRRMS
jgi:hypothetical protein